MKSADFCSRLSDAVIVVRSKKVHNKVDVSTLLLNQKGQKKQGVKKGYPNTVVRCLTIIVQQNSVSQLVCREIILCFSEQCKFFYPVYYLAKLLVCNV